MYSDIGFTFETRGRHFIPLEINIRHFEKSWSKLAWLRGRIALKVKVMTKLMHLHV